MLLAPLLFLLSISHVKGIETTFKKDPKKAWLFKDFMKKFDIMTVWDDIEANSRKAGKTANLTNEMHNIMKRIDETDELLSLKTEKGDPKILIESRRSPPGFDRFKVFRPIKENFQEPSQDLWDPNYVRYRLNELMKQLVYLARNKMVGMEIVRDEFRHTALYKMGFLFSKTDEMVKNFVRFAARCYKTCTYRLSWASKRHQLIDILTTQERLLFKWFHIDLMHDLILENDNIAREIILNYTTGRREKFEKLFVD